MKYHGKHNMVDITDFKVDAEEGGRFIFQLMKKSLEQSSCTIVHEQLVILGKDEKTPPGFTSVILIDESHMTAHCYSDSGWLAVDIFTCGSKNDPEIILNYFISTLQKTYPTIHISFSYGISRFPYHPILN